MPAVFEVRSRRAPDRVLFSMARTQKQAFRLATEYERPRRQPFQYGGLCRNNKAANAIRGKSPHVSRRWLPGDIRQC
jgi:hypothetical protein